MDTKSAIITSEANVTIEDVVAEATRMWKVVTAKINSAGCDVASQAVSLMSTFRRTNPQFCRSYPIVLRYMVEMRQYSPKALKLYLTKIQRHPWTTECDYIKSQADYVVFLYKAKHRHYRRENIVLLHAQTVAILTKESESFKKLVQETQQTVQDREDSLKKNAQDDLKEFVKMAAPTIESRAGTLRVETDLPSRINGVIEVEPGPSYTPADYLLA